MFNIVKLFSAPTLEVEWDDVVRQNLKPSYQGRNNAQISIRLFNLLKGLGCVQAKRVNSTWLTSLMDYNYLLERLIDAPELKLKITETTSLLGSERLGRVSEEFGIGLSVVVTSELFDLQPSTISKITNINTKRPDWRCILRDNRTMVVEAKGSSNQYTSNSQLKDAIVQKNEVPANIGIATASLLNENSSSKMTLVDPPIIDDGEPNERKRHIFRANHYASVFSFLGEDVLSLYFEKMAKRLSGRIGAREMDDKEMMFVDLNYNVPHIRIDDREFAGHLYGPVDDQYIFLGVDKNLLSYQGFMTFNDANEEKLIQKDYNSYYIHTDGILVVNIVNSARFFEDYNIESIGVSEDNIALSDLDSIKSSSYKRYVKYLLDKCGATTKWINGGLKARLGEVDQNYYFYHVSNLKNYNPSYRALMNIQRVMFGHNGVLVTNLSICDINLGCPCIDRNDFEQIAASHGASKVVKSIFFRS